MSVSVPFTQALQKWCLAIDKVPHAFQNGKLFRIATNRPDTWLNYDTAKAVAQQRGAGLGYLLGGTHGGLILCGVDIDGKHTGNDPMTPDPSSLWGALRELIGDWIPKTYTELSVSRKGVHVLGYVRPEVLTGSKKGIRYGDLEIELYAYPQLGQRFFVQGSAFAGSPATLTDITPLIQRILSLTAPAAPQPQPQDTASQPPSTTHGIRRLIESVANAPEGNRHNTLIKVAQRLQRLGLLWHVENELRDAARTAGLEGKEIDDAIRWVKEKVRPRLSLSTEKQSAKTLSRFVRDRIRFFSNRGWWYYDGRRWKRDSEGHLVRLKVSDAFDQLRRISLKRQAAGDKSQDWKALALKSLEWGHKVHKLNKIVSLLAGMLHDDRDLDAHAHLLNAHNGTIDLRTGELHPHDPALLMSKIANAPYDPKATAPTWERFLTEVFQGDRELIRWIQKVIGYAATGEVSEHALFILWGRGANGKSTFVETISYVLGDYARAIAPDTLIEKKYEAHPTELAFLYGVRFASIAETKGGDALHAQKVKQLTGGDTIAARYMRQDFFTFSPTHKVFLSTNSLPKITDASEGIWRRIRLIPFRAYFPLDKQDRTLSQKLKAEAAGILRWIVEGAVRYFAEGLGDIPASVSEATKNYRDTEDILAGWITDNCELGEGFLTPFDELYENYSHYCTANGLEAINKNLFARKLTEKGLEAVRTDKKRMRKGIRIKPTEPEPAPPAPEPSHSSQPPATQPAPHSHTATQSQLPVASHTPQLPAPSHSHTEPDPAPRWQGTEGLSESEFAARVAKVDNAAGADERGYPADWDTIQPSAAPQPQPQKPQRRRKSKGIPLPENALLVMDIPDTPYQMYVATGKYNKEMAEAVRQSVLTGLPLEQFLTTKPQPVSLL